MLHISNGILKLNIKDGGMDFLWNLSLTLIFMTGTVLYPGANRFYRLLQLLGYIMLVFFTFAELYSGNKGKGNIKILVGLITIWYGIFFIFSCLSIIWAYSADSVIRCANSLFRVFLLGFCLSQHIDTEEKLNKAMKLFIFTSMVLFLYSLIRTPREQWFDGYLGNVTGNSISILGLCGAFAMVMSVYFAMANNEKIFYIAAAANFIFVVAATSRKALIFALLGVVLLELLYTWRRNYAVSVILILVLMGLFTLLVLKSGISEAMNRRLMSMYSYFADEGGKKDNSISVRMYFIMTARNIFKQHPLVGVGLGNFAYYLNDIYGWATYAHNNYMEIISDLGIIGFVIYYWFYAYLIIKLLGQTLRKKKISLLFLVIMILFMVIEYGQVTYYQYIFQFIVAFAYCAVCISDGSYYSREEKDQAVEDYQAIEEYQAIED